MPLANKVLFSDRFVYIIRLSAMVVSDVHNLAFYKKTRRGGVVKVVRELYLRDGIPCGSNACSECSSNLTGSVSFEDRKDRDGKWLDDLSGDSNQMYLVFDTNVLIQVRK